MISWYSKDILYFVGYAFMGFGGLALLVNRKYLSRWARFFVGLSAVIYGTVGWLLGSQLFRSIKNIIQVMPWSEVETSRLVYAAAGVEWASLVLQFSFAAVGAGLIVNAIAADKPFAPLIANTPLDIDTGDKAIRTN